VRVLCGDTRKLSRSFLSNRGWRLLRALSVGALALLPTTTAWAYSHHSSKVRFVEHSPEAFERARRENKPVFLLISAVWCYWCKYFDQNALETEEVATYLNAHYLSVFVDPDRRTDVARRYVRGLPMIVLLDSYGQVRQSFAGALRKEDFLSILKRVEGEVRDDLARGIAKPPAARTVALPPVPATPERFEQLRRGMLSFLDEHLDTANGGFGIGDKHPAPRLLAYLLDRYEATKDRRYLTAVEKSLAGILGGIYDPVDGGFFRYAEGREWRQPHYEKLVYLNAGLAAVFDRAHRLTGNPRYRVAADTTVAYLLRTLYDARIGGFYSSQISEPAYYRLAPPERRNATKPPINRDKVTAWSAEAALAFLAMGQYSDRKALTDVGLRTLDSLRQNCLTNSGVFQIFDEGTARGQILGQLEANAWAARAFVEGYRVSRRQELREAAERVLTYSMADFFDAARGAFVQDGDSPASLGANGIMAAALMRAHQLTGRAEYRDTARRVIAALGGPARALLVDEEGGATVFRMEDSVFYLQAYGQLIAAP
jgi:uncharacterized protein